MKIRIGIPKSTGALPVHVRRLGQPAILSAGALWQPRRGRFGRPGAAMQGLDCALDSAGYARMVQGDGYPWTVEQYVAVVLMWAWAWWSQMDYPCEADLAPSSADVLRRVEATAELLADCRAEAQRLRGFGKVIADPVPVLQGRAPADYRLSVTLAGEVLGGDWPAFVGVGSMCMRPVNGPEGVLAVVAALDAALPPHVRLHLFGVKTDALVPLRHHPRIESVDSQAWGTRVRKQAWADRRLLPAEDQVGPVCGMPEKKAALTRFAGAQLARIHGPGAVVLPALPPEAEQLTLLGRGRGDGGRR